MDMLSGCAGCGTNQTLTDKPWHGLPFPSDRATESLFIASTEIIIGDGASTLFWHAHWLGGIPLKIQFPALFKHSRGARLTVLGAITDTKWIQCIKRNPTLQVLTEYLQLADHLSNMQLQPNTPESRQHAVAMDGQWSVQC